MKRKTRGSKTLPPQPVFAQPQPEPDPTHFVVRHPSDNPLYKLVDTHRLGPVPEPSDNAVEPIFTLETAWGLQGTARIKTIQKSGQIVFHAVGDTGNVRGPRTQSLVADKMVADFQEANPADVPAFFFHLGDVVYSFGEAQYYYDQFYEPYRNYPAPIVGIPGNHDGLVYNGDREASLEAYMRNFCAAEPLRTPEAGGLVRTAMTEPSVYFTLEAPLVRILGLYSNVLEDPGVISSQGDPNSPLDDRQLNFLIAALNRVHTEKFAGAVIIAVHHPPFTYSVDHSGSPRMLADIDHCCQQANVWPHAVLAAHAHNYQRYTRVVGSKEIPYIVAGGGGHGLAKLHRSGYGPIRTPQQITDTLTLENYDDENYGYLRILVNDAQLRIEYQPQSDGVTAKTPDDVVTIDLKTRKRVVN